MGPWTLGGPHGNCCGSPSREWVVEMVVRVWPRLAAEEVYLVGCLEHDELLGPEAWRLKPDEFQDALLISKTGGVIVKAPDAGLSPV